MTFIRPDLLTRPNTCNLTTEAQLLIVAAWAGADNEGCFNILPELKYRGLQLTSDAFTSTITTRNTYILPPLIPLCDGITYVEGFLEANKGYLTSIAFKPSIYRPMLFEKYPPAIKFEEHHLLSALEDCTQKSKKNLLLKRLKELQVIDKSLDFEATKYLTTTVKVPNKPSIDDFEKFIIDEALFFDYEIYWSSNDGWGWQGDWKQNCRKFAGRYARENPNEKTPKYMIEKKVKEFTASKRKSNGNL